MPQDVDGAKPTVFLASSPEVAGVSGTFINSKITYDEGVAKPLWKGIPR